MRRRSLLGLALALSLLLLAPSGGADPGSEKRRIDERIQALQAKIASARERESVLSTEISAVTSRIRGLEGDVTAAQSRLSTLEVVLARQQRRLDRLNALYELQTRRLVFLQGQYAAAMKRLNRRVVEIYTQETPDAVSFVLAASSFGELLDQIDFLQQVSRQDDRIATQVKGAKIAMRETRERTKATRSRVAETTREIAARTAEQRSVRDRLVANRNQLTAVRSLKNQALSSVHESKAAYLNETEGLQARSAALAARIRAAQTASSSSAPPPASSSGLAWPVNGPVTSGFGWRWGRMHEGIDIAVPSGTPVHASAAGTVIYAGWMGGYGNLVVIDHGGGLATAYAHNTSVAVSPGQGVSQGQVVAYAGSTGHSTGPHVHFEVRVDGTPVDPLGYL